MSVTGQAFTGVGGVDWRSQIEQNIQTAPARDKKALFRELNPHLVGDTRFESRWRKTRKDAAVLIPIIAHPEPTVLLTVRASDMPSHPGQIALPGGRVHAEDQGPIDTALRETEEEVGIPRDHVEVIGSLGIHEGGHGFAVTPVIGIVSPEAPIVNCPREVAESFQTPLSFLADQSNHVKEERELEGVPYYMYAMPYDRFHIWGLTAGILRSLSELMNNQPASSG